MNSKFAPSTEKKFPKDIIKGKDFWGPIIWALIHILAIEVDRQCGTDNSLLTSNAIKYYVLLLNTLTKLLPCEDCKKHLTHTLNVMPPASYIKSAGMFSQSAFLFSYALHDSVNVRLSKESPEYKQIHEFYVNTCSNSKYWGPVIWATIHILAATLRPENAEYFETFLNCLTFLLPNEKSRETLSTNLKILAPGPYLTNNHDSFLYSYALHDMVNEKIGKESPRYDEIKSFYFRGLSQECKECNL